MIIITIIMIIMITMMIVITINNVNFVSHCYSLIMTSNNTTLESYGNIKIR